MMINQKILAILRTFLNLRKSFTPRRQLPKLLLLNFFAKFLTETKYLMKNLTFVRQKISVDEVIKPINSQTNNKHSGNDALTAEFYKHISNELAPVLLDVYDIWRKLRIMCVTSRTEIISVVFVTSGDKLIHMIKVAFTNIQSKIKINGLLSELFTLM